LLVVLSSITITIDVNVKVIFLRIFSHCVGLIES